MSDGYSDTTDSSWHPQFLSDDRDRNYCGDRFCDGHVLSHQQCVDPPEEDE